MLEQLGDDGQIIPPGAEPGPNTAPAPAPAGSPRFGVVAGPGRFGRVVFHSQAEQIAFLRQMVNKYAGNRLIHDKAIDVVFNWAHCPPKAKLCHAVAIGRWVQKHVTYVNEGVETFQTPVRTLTYRFGDCDDFATLTASMVQALGIETELCGLEWAGMYRHIFARAVIPVPGAGVRRIPLDGTLKEDVGTLPNPVTISIARGDNPRVLAL